LFVVEHDLDVIRHADWIVDVGPAAGQHGGRILYSGPPAGLAKIEASCTRVHLFDEALEAPREPRTPATWLELAAIKRHNLTGLDAKFPIGLLTSVTGVSGSGKSSLVSQALVELVSQALGHEDLAETDDAEDAVIDPTEGKIAGGLAGVERLVVVDQKPIGRTPRSNLATYTGLFDHVRKLFASTKQAKARKYDAGRFSFNVAKGRCEKCEGEGFVFVEMLFLPSVYAPCPVCHGARYNAKTLEITVRDKSIADILAMTVDDAFAFFADEPPIRRALEVVRQVGLGYLRLGQPATELSGGEAQRIKLATELQRAQRGTTLYILDEPTTGLHPSDVEKLLAQLDALVAAGNTVILVEHEMRVVAASDWVIDLGPGAGDQGGEIIAAGPPAVVAQARGSKTAPYLRAYLERRARRAA
ncbi:MAG: excinuclease ABC subunit A, partial [Kofleriaceae bacterium]